MAENLELLAKYFSISSERANDWDAEYKRSESTLSRFNYFFAYLIKLT